MARSVEKENVYDGSYVVKKSRKHNILAFILCVLIAFTIWLYATNKNSEEEKELKDNITDATQTAEVSESASEG